MTRRPMTTRAIAYARHVAIVVRHRRSRAPGSRPPSPCCLSSPAVRRASRFASAAPSLPRARPARGAPRSRAATPAARSTKNHGVHLGLVHRVALVRAPADWRVPAWEVRVLFDGDCPLCVREVDFLRAKDDGRGRLDLVDIADLAYDPSLNRGIDFETAMASIHGITREGRVIAGIEVFERAYAAVGLGGVRLREGPSAARGRRATYDFWAERRLAVTGRPTMSGGDGGEGEARRRRRENRGAAKSE